MKILLIVMLYTIIYANNIEGKHDKGLVYYKYIFQKELKYSGKDFTVKHTKKEWTQLFENNSDGFKKEFMGITPDLDKLLISKKFSTISPHIEAFATHYAKDSGQSPQCK